MSGVGRRRALVVALLPTPIGVLPKRQAQRGVVGLAIGPALRRAAVEQCRFRRQAFHAEALRYHRRQVRMRGQEVDNGAAVVATTGSTHFVEFRMQEVLRTLARQAQARVMEFDFNGSKLREQRMSRI